MKATTIFFQYSNRVYLFILSLLSLLLWRIKFIAWFAISHLKTQVFLSPRQARKQLTKVNNLSVLSNYIFCLSEIYHIVSQKQIHDSPGSDGNQPRNNSMGKAGELVKQAKIVHVAQVCNIQFPFCNIRSFRSRERRFEESFCIGYSHAVCIWIMITSGSSSIDNTMR